MAPVRPYSILTNYTHTDIVPHIVCHYDIDWKYESGEWSE